MKRLSPRPFLVLAVLVGIALSGCSDHRSAVAPSGDRGPGLVLQDIPPGYYDAVDDGDPASLRATVHDAIDDHQRFPYTSTATDTWDVLELADQDPGDPTHILDVYKNASYLKEGGGNSNYTREHTWPNSYGYPDDNSSNYPYTDCHALFLCDYSYNSSRGNRLYRTCDAACDEKPTEVNNGQGGGTGVYPGNSNWGSGTGPTGTWETWIGRRGDVARALFYLDVRYEGGTHGITGIPEPDLILTDDEGLIAASNTGSNESVAYMGILTVLLQWHYEDPVDDVERARNDEVYSFQGNRNPFIDHPEWVDCIFNGDCTGGGDTTPPDPPAGLAAVAGDGQVDLDWDDNQEPDLAGYNVYRSTTSGGSYGRINGGLVAGSTFSDTGAANGTTYYYVVTAVDDSGNESGTSNEASATPQGQGGGPAVWINEFHYDNKGGDQNEFVEVAGAAGTNLSGWQLLGYNGNGGGVYDTVNLSGTLPDQENGFGVLSFDFTGLQNGSPDGIALVDNGNLVEFLSYEGSFTATDGPAAGMSSADIGVSEPSDAPRNRSLQLAGDGTRASDFTWQAPQPNTRDQPNTGQTFGGGGGDTTPPADPTGLAAAAGDGQVDLDWDDNGEPDLDGYNVHRSTAPGGPYTQVNGSPLGSSAFTDNGVTNGVTYYYVVSAIDLSGNESGFSNEASATPQGGGGGGVMHVASITLSTEPAGGPNEKGRADVVVLDDLGTPVQGVQVTGTFTGDIGETVSGTTDASGTAVLVSNKKAKGPVSFGFCVDSASKPGWTYDAGANVETCDSFGGPS